MPTPSSFLAVTKKSFSLLQHQKPLIAATLTFLFIASAAQVIEPYIYGRIIDVIVEQTTSDTSTSLWNHVLPYLSIWGLIFIGTALFSTLQLYCTWLLGNMISEHFAKTYMQKMMQWSHQRISKHQPGTLLKRFDDAWNGLFFLTDTLPNSVFPTLIQLVFVFILASLIEWKLLIIVSIALLVAVILAVHAWKKATPKQNAINSSWGKFTGIVGENITHAGTIQNFAKEAHAQRKLMKTLKKIIKSQLSINVFWSIFHGFGSTLVLLARLAIFIFGLILIQQKSLSIGELITFLGLVGFLLVPVQYMIANALPRINKGVTNLQKFFALFEEDNDVIEIEGARRLKLSDGKITLDDILFTYLENTSPTLKHVSLTIPGGSSCALVGPSGGGKSTIVKLLNRTIDPTQGEVYIDDQNLTHCTLKSIRSNIGIVPQETLLFHDTILNNIRFAKPSASKAEVIQAAKKAQAHTFIENLPKGYNSIVGERGVKLSGGERQRISIARIFLLNPPIIILDESTSALDSETEHKLQEVLKDVMKDRTSIIIAHRLSTIYLADQIAVVEGGQITDLGTHDQLLQKTGVYERLWKLQSGGYLDT